MNREELETHARGLSATVLDTLLKGQEEYARSQSDAFGNFSRLSDHLGISREKVLLVYLTKHIDGILAYASGHRSQRESVHGRIQDSIVYLMILDGMVADLEAQEAAVEIDMRTIEEAAQEYEAKHPELFVYRDPYGPYPPLEPCLEDTE